MVEMKENMPSEPSSQGLGPSQVKADGRTVIVERGDSLCRLSSRVYGRSDERVLELIQKSNPSIRDLDFIHPGQKVIFPPLPEYAAMRSRNPLTGFFPAPGRVLIASSDLSRIELNERQE